MATPDSTARNGPTRGSTTGAGAAESLKGTVHHIQDMGDTIRENAMDFVDAMFGTPRQSGEPRAGAPRAGAGVGEDVTRRPEERSTAGDIPRRTDDAAARTPTSTASNANNTQTRSSESQPAMGPATEPGIGEKRGGAAEDAPTQGPPALPPRDGGA